jgi:hypothetical protein
LQKSVDISVFLRRPISTSYLSSQATREGREQAEELAEHATRLLGTIMSHLRDSNPETGMQHSPEVADLCKYVFSFCDVALQFNTYLNCRSVIEEILSWTEKIRTGSKGRQLWNIDATKQEGSKLKEKLAQTDRRFQVYYNASRTEISMS